MKERAKRVSCDNGNNSLNLSINLSMPSGSWYYHQTIRRRQLCDSRMAFWQLFKTKWWKMAQNDIWWKKCWSNSHNWKFKKLMKVIMENCYVILLIRSYILTNVLKLCKKANQKLQTLARLSSYIDLIKSEILMHSSIR